MKYLPRVIDFKYLSGYKIELHFDNGRVKLVDLKNELWGGVFLPLRNIDFFKKVKLEGSTIRWPNGADIAPETLYEIGIDITPKPAKAQGVHHRQRQLRKSA